MASEQHEIAYQNQGNSLVASGFNVVNFPSKRVGIYKDESYLSPTSKDSSNILLDYAVWTPNHEMAVRAIKEAIANANKDYEKAISGVGKGPEIKCFQDDLISASEQKKRANIDDVGYLLNSSKIDLKVDKSSSSDHNLHMENVSRPELEAKLEAIEARMDGRVASVEGKIDALLAKLDAREEVAEQRERTAEVRAQAAESRMGRIESETTAIRGDMKSLRMTMITTAVASVLTTVFGVAAFNATLVSNMVSSFESGKSTATAIVQATEQMKQTQEQLKALQEQLDQQSRRKPAK